MVTANTSIPSTAAASDAAPLRSNNRTPATCTTLADKRIGRTAVVMLTMRRSHAFSLVELLVVIGIIALWISILLPALSKARAQANAVACLSNLHRIALALQTYSDQWNGFVF